MRTRITGAALAALALGVVPLPARAAGPVVWSQPGATLTNYATVVAVAQVGGELTHVNTDIDLHDVVARGHYGSDDETWCLPPDPTKPEGPGNPRPFPLGRCPLFWSPLIGIAETSPVQGLEHLEAARVYTFYCTKHPGNMEGHLLALPGA